jgi:protein TonB
MHVSGLYRSSALTHIELTLQTVSRPAARNIPRPPLRPETSPRPPGLDRLKSSPKLLPPVEALRIEPADADLPPGLVERVGIPATGGLTIAHWPPPDAAGYSDGYGATPRGYLEMVRLKIERHKEYPEWARIRQIEGRVTVTFVIAPDGGVSSAEVARPSAHQVLDDAALRAVHAASPFPKPPLRLFEGVVPCRVTVVFELT